MRLRGGVEDSTPLFFKQRKMYVINKRFNDCAFVSIAGESITLSEATQKQLKKIHEKDSSIVDKQDAKPKKARTKDSNTTEATE